MSKVRSANYWTTKEVAIATLIEADKSERLYKTIAEKIVEIRKQKGVDQDDLARLIFISRHNMYDIEACRGRCDAILIHAIAHALNVSIFELLPETKLVLELASKKHDFADNSPMLTSYSSQEYFHFQAHVAKRLYERRMELRMSLDDLAGALGGNRNLKLLLKKIEDGITKADIFLLLALAYALEITVDELLPPTKVDRVEGFLRGVNSKDLIVLHTLLERKPETLKDALSRRIKEVYLEEDAIARGLFFAGVH